MLWTAKLRGYDEGNILAARAKRYGLTIYYYPINFYEKSQTFYFIASGIAKGRLNRPGNARYVVKLEWKQEAFLSITAQPVSVEGKALVRVFYNPAIIHCKPAVIYPSGHEEWEVCAFNKADLDNVISVGKALYNLELISLRRARVTNVHVVAAAPNLSDRQRNALELAIKRGYYAYPRKTELTELAKISGLAVSTFHAHLRKAENKIMPHVFSLSGQ